MRTPLVLLFCLFLQSAFSFTKPSLVFPPSGSKYNKTETSVSIKVSPDEIFSFSNNNSITIKGSKSGQHEFTSKILNENSLITFTPKVKFLVSEIVTIEIKSNNHSTDITTFSFETEKQELKINPLKFFDEENKASNNNRKINKTEPTSFKGKSSDSLPPDFPVRTVFETTPSDGYFFLSDFALRDANTGFYLMILDNAGYPVYYKKLDSAAYDFKKQPNGNLTYYYSRGNKFYEMNPSYRLIDSFSCGNGYSTDLHELRLLNNGHALIASYDPQIIDMSAIVSGGNPNATVIGLIIQELDENKNVIFQWRSWDHFQITDATHEDLTSLIVDYVHGNSIELDNDGNIIISSRHLDEITKINRTNGDIIWRLGGKHNQFTYSSDSVEFSHQHAVRRIANGHITLFDNGNFRSGSTINFSRAAEYELDELNHTISLVWQYIDTPPVYGFAMGNTQRLSNGNTLVGWGFGDHAFTEVNSKGTKVFELTFPVDVASYRVFKDSWTPLAVSMTGSQVPESFKLYQNFPNPFNPSTTIRFDIPEKSSVKISIYNLTGQKVEEVSNTVMSSGSYQYTWNSTGFASGTYFYRVETNSFVETKRMILLK